MVGRRMRADEVQRNPLNGHFALTYLTYNIIIRIKRRRGSACKKVRTASSIFKSGLR